MRGELARPIPAGLGEGAGKKWEMRGDQNAGDHRQPGGANSKRSTTHTITSVPPSKAGVWANCPKIRRSGSLQLRRSSESAKCSNLTDSRRWPCRKHKCQTMNLIRGTSTCSWPLAAAFSPVFCLEVAEGFHGDWQWDAWEPFEVNGARADGRSGGSTTELDRTIVCSHAIILFP